MVALSLAIFKNAGFVTSNFFNNGRFVTGKFDNDGFFISNF